MVKQKKLTAGGRATETATAVKGEVIIFKPNREYGKAEYEVLSDIIRRESNATGVKIILAPYSCDVEVLKGGGYSE